MRLQCPVCPCSVLCPSRDWRKTYLLLHSFFFHNSAQSLGQQPPILSRQDGMEISLCIYSPSIQSRMSLSHHNSTNTGMYYPVQSHPSPQYISHTPLPLPLHQCLFILCLLLPNPLNPVPPRPRLLPILPRAVSTHFTQAPVHFALDLAAAADGFVQEAFCVAFVQGGHDFGAVW